MLANVRIRLYARTIKMRLAYTYTKRKEEKKKKNMVWYLGKSADRDNSQHPSQHLFFSSPMDSDPREKIMLNDDVSSEKSKGKGMAGSR